jgi:hypothetical protein
MMDISTSSPSHTNAVMAGLVPAIHALMLGDQDVDTRDRRQVYAVCEKQTATPGHDDAERAAP